MSFHRFNFITFLHIVKKRLPDLLTVVYEGFITAFSDNLYSVVDIINIIKIYSDALRYTDSCSEKQG